MYSRTYSDAFRTLGFILIISPFFSADSVCYDNDQVVYGTYNILTIYHQMCDYAFMIWISIDTVGTTACRVCVLTQIKRDGRQDCMYSQNSAVAIITCPIKSNQQIVGSMFAIQEYLYFITISLFPLYR